MKELASLLLCQVSNDRGEGRFTIGEARLLQVEKGSEKTEAVRRLVDFILEGKAAAGVTVGAYILDKWDMGIANSFLMDDAAGETGVETVINFIESTKKLSITLGFDGVQILQESFKPVAVYSAPKEETVATPSSPTPKEAPKSKKDKSKKDIDNVLDAMSADS